VDGEDGLAAVASAMEEPRTAAATATTQHPNMVEEAVLEAAFRGDVATQNPVLSMEDGVDGEDGLAAIPSIPTHSTAADTATTQLPNMAEDPVMEAKFRRDVVLSMEDGVDGADGQAVESALVGD